MFWTMSGAPDSRSRRMWRALEPVHAVTYFAPEAKAACEEVGTKGYWMSYFAQRAAPLGAARPEIVAALFYNFSLRLVARAVPDVWALAGPETFLGIRLEAVDAALHRLAGAELLSTPEVADAASIARAAAAAAPTAGRALGAANAALEWPQAPHLVLWHAQTVLRESRGDGHVAALQLADLDPVETLVLFAADLGMDADWLRERRGWAPEEWSAGVARVTERGLLADGGLTAAGAALRAAVEAHTDALSDAPWRAVGDAEAERLVKLVEPLVTAIVAGDGVAAGNPMGMRPLVSAP